MAEQSIRERIREAQGETIAPSRLEEAVSGPAGPSAGRGSRQEDPFRSQIEGNPEFLLPDTPDIEGDTAIMNDPNVPIRDRIAASQRLQLMTGEGGNVEAMAREERDAFLADQVQQSDEFAGTLGEPGFDHLGVRADLGLSNRFSEQRSKWFSYYPNGDFVEVLNPPNPETGRNRSSTILVRRHENEPYFEFDARSVDKFELLYDIADLSAEVPIAVAELAVLRGGKLIWNAIRAFIGGAGGEVAREAVEELRGFNDDSPIEVAGNAAVIGTVGAAGSVLLGQIIGEGAVNVVRGAPNIGLAQGAQEAIQAQQRLGISRFTTDEVVRSPILQLLGRQSRATVGTLGEHLERRNTEVVRSLSWMRDEDVARLFSDDIQSLHDDAFQEVIDSIRGSRVPLSQAGTTIQTQIGRYSEISQTTVTESYRRAREHFEPEFDLTPLNSVMDNLERGVMAMGRNGQPVRLGEPLAPQIETLIQQIRSLDPSLPEINGDRAMDQLIALRGMIWELSVAPINADATEREVARQAGQLGGAITRVILNPVGGDEAFVAAWRQANAEAAERFANLERIVLVQAARSETPAQLAHRLARPRRVDELVFLRDNIMSESKWEDVRGAFMSQLVDAAEQGGRLGSRPRRITQVLDEFDPETLNVLMTQEEQRLFRRASVNLDQLNSTEVQAALVEQRLPRQQARRIFRNREDTARSEDVVERLLTSGTEAQRNSARAAIMETVWEDAVRPGRRAGELVDPNALQSAIEDLRETGAWRLLTDGDKEMLADLETVARFVPARVDAGTALQAAEVGSGLRGFQRTAMLHLLESLGFGKLMISPTWQRLLVGRGRQPTTTRMLRVMGAVSAEVIDEVNRERDFNDGNIPPTQDLERLQSMPLEP